MHPQRPQSRIGRLLEEVSQWATHWTGSSWAFTFAVLVIVAWLITVPLFDFSDTWQLVINTGTTIVTFLMVFLIQRAQNKDALAIQLKLNEIVASLQGASNRLIDIEGYIGTTSNSRYYRNSSTTSSARTPWTKRSDATTRRSNSTLENWVRVCGGSTPCEQLGLA